MTTYLRKGTRVRFRTRFDTVGAFKAGEVNGKRGTILLRAVVDGKHDSGGYALRQRWL